MLYLPLYPNVSLAQSRGGLQVERQHTPLLNSNVKSDGTVGSPSPTCVQQPNRRPQSLPQRKLLPLAIPSVRRSRCLQGDDESSEIQ